jgi:putative RNA 2'-phosphotransferase
MQTKDKTKISKFLSLVLRHNPEAIGLRLDHQGWASVEELIACAMKKGRPLTKNTIVSVVATSDKKRFSRSPDGQRIRVNQGHSIPVDLGLNPMEPPKVLYHGTASRFLKSIRKDGLRPSGRQQCICQRTE